MPLSHSPSSSIGSKKTIFQKLFGKVKGAVMALGILSTPALAQTGSNHNTEPKMLSTEERLTIAQKMNLESFKSIQELEQTIEYTWSQLKDTSKAPKEIRDQYGHITTEGLTWLESELPAEYLRRAQKYKNIERELEKMDKNDPKYGVWEYSLMCLGALIIGLVAYKYKFISKKELERLQNESDIAHEEATKHMREKALVEGENTVLKEKIAELRKRSAASWKDGEIVDAEIVEPKGEGHTPESETASLEIPEWAKDTFLAEDSYTRMRNMLITDLSTDTPSQEAGDLQESITNLSNITGTDNEKAGRLNMMSERFITYAHYKKMPEETIIVLLRALEKSFQGQEFYFGSYPVIGQPFDNTQMLQIGTASSAMLKVSKVLSLPVFGPNRHPEAVTKNIIYSRGKVNCS